MSRQGDGHNEYAIGGAWMAASERDGSTNGSTVCYGEPSHPGSDVHLANEGLLFTVAVDSVSLTGAPCGDFLLDESIVCLEGCVVPFAPGLEGVYRVMMDAPLGWVGGPISSH